MTMKAVLAAAGFALVAGCATPGAPVRGDAAKQQVAATERAFAKTMADRDLKAFASFLSDDTVFFSGPRPLHGKQAVIEAWSRFYDKPQAPFSWAPKVVEVSGDGMLGISGGPVYDPQGKLFACFSSVWRQESPGIWKIVFDRGTGPQECEAQ
jgi:ketosteroid isomerase-like protein